MIDFHDIAEHPPYAFLWSLFPILMFIAFIVMPGPKKNGQKRSRGEQIVSFVLGIALLAVAGWFTYAWLKQHHHI